MFAKLLSVEIRESKYIHGIYEIEKYIPCTYEVDTYFRLTLNVNCNQVRRVLDKY